MYRNNITEWEHHEFEYKNAAGHVSHDVNPKLYIGVHGVVNRLSYRHFRGNLQHHERRASFNYDDGIRAKYSRRLWGRSFSEIGHYLPPNYFRTWYLNIRDTGTHSHTRVCSTAHWRDPVARDAEIVRQAEMPFRAQNTKLHPAMETRRRILLRIFMAAYLWAYRNTGETSLKWLLLLTS